MNNPKGADPLTLIRKHDFAKVEDTRAMMESSLDPMMLRRRMESRPTTAEFDDDNPVVLVAKITDNMHNAQREMELASILLDDELDDPEGWN
jgi:hypothetical protein